MRPLLVIQRRAERASLKIKSYALTHSRQRGAEMYARLKSSASWARICVFRLYANGEYKSSHAVVLYQPTQASNVFLYDKTLSSIDTNTQSHDLIEIISSINQNILREGVLLEDPRWID